MIDDETGKVVFFNLLTGEKKGEKPFGLLLSKEDDDLWQRSRDSVTISVAMLNFVENRLSRNPHDAGSQHKGGTVIGSQNT